jgi:predicted nuclease of restriction endonuclease-like (RecB) superfamily
VNKRLVDLYWNLGKIIVQRQEAHGWGKSVVERLSGELQMEFPGSTGYSAANLWRMRHFYHAYRENEFLAPLAREISWTNNYVIFEKCKDDLQREFYLRMTKKYGWTKEVLIHQIENKSYEKYLLNQTSFDQTLPENLRVQAKLAVKDEYTFDFLELAGEHSEFELEQAILKKVRTFLIEMGGDYAFIAFRL